MQMDVSAVLGQGVTAHESGDLATAQLCYERILSAVPGHADANHLLGVVAFQRGDLDTARRLIEHAISLDGDVALYHANLGRVARQRDDPTAAVAAFRAAIRLSPEDAGLHVDLASALIAAGDADAARARANLALELDDTRGDAHLCLGLALQDVYGPAQEDAVAALRRAVALDPVLAGAHLGLGLAHQSMGDATAAKDAYIAAVNADPALIEAWVNLGNLAREALAFADAMTCYRKALEVDAESAAAWGNLGVTLHETGDVAAALDAYDKAVALAPVDAELARNRAMGLLAAGRYADGWPAYAARWQTARFLPLKRDWPVAEWAGENLTGKSLYVHAEQGLGDTVQFCRYVSVLADRGARVTLECPQTMHRLLGTLGGVYALKTPGDPLPKIDFHVPLLSIPAAIDLDPNDDPAPSPYLRAPKKAVDVWRNRIATLPPGKKIGIAWRGSPDHARDAVRSPGLAPFRALMSAPDITLVSLQKDHAADDLATDGDGIVDWTSDIADFADSAGLMMHLDAVVSCDSAPLHLAGALGVRCFAVLPHVAEWRWGMDGDTTPWYPTMTLVRQPSFGDWDGALARVADSL